MTLEELTRFLYEHGPTWVKEQAASVMASGSALTEPLQAHLRLFFGTDAARTRLTTAEITNPPFYAELLQRGADPRDLLQFVANDAVTFESGILLDRGASLTHEILFHELVHVVQYRLLGVDEFVRRYVDGWMAGRDRFLDDPQRRYEYVPLERMAFSLQAVYARDHTVVFSVEGAVRDRL